MIERANAILHETARACLYASIVLALAKAAGVPMLYVRAIDPTSIAYVAGAYALVSAGQWFVKRGG